MNSAEGNRLEDRLRSLILSNSESSSRQGSPANGSIPLEDGAISPGLTGNVSVPLDPSTNTQGGAVPQPNSPKTSRKRPNQAQRRQMSAQLSIPIDHRP